MKNKFYCTFILISLFALVSCSDSYGTFTEVVGQSDKEAMLEEAEQKNGTVKDIDEYELYLTYPAKSDSENSTRYTALKGTLKNGRISTDLLEINGSYGAIKTYVRFDETDDKYYAYTEIKYTTAEDQNGQTTSVDYGIYEECSYFDADATYTAEDLTSSYESSLLSEVSFLSAYLVVPVSDMEVYTSDKGYYKFCITLSSYYTSLVLDQDGTPVNINASNLIDDSTYFNCTFSFWTILDGVSTTDFVEANAESEQKMDDYVTEFWNL
jgi:hypothetical protein